jgi:ankyrin repeat protein
MYDKQGGTTALHYAAWHGFTDVALLLLAKGANLNLQDKVLYAGVALSTSHCC